MEKETENEAAGAQTLAGAATEEAADFARVAAMVGSGEPEAVTGTDAAPEVQAMDAAESMAGFLGIAGVGLDKLAGFTHTGAALAENSEAIAGAAVKVLRKYPWGARVLDFFESGTGAEEVALVVCLLPLAGAVKADLAQRREADEAPADASPAIPAPAPAQPGRPVMPVMKDVHEMGRA